MKMKHKLLYCLLLLALPLQGLQAQRIIEKTNLLWWGTLTPNVGMELYLSPRWSVDANFTYHPWKLSESVSLRHWMISPEARYWFCRTFEGSFVGLHALAGKFNVHAIPMTGLPDEYEYAGFMLGAGLSYGYHLPLARRWSMEFTAGAGFIRFDYDKYECKACREKVARGYYYYVGPTRLGVSLIYFLQ
jgi:hypothetical protein